MSELSPEARKLFEAAREAYAPSTEQLDALQVALQARIAAEAAALSSASSAATGAAKLALAVKVATVLGVATALVVGASLLGRPEPPAAAVQPGSTLSVPATSQLHPAPAALPAPAAPAALPAAPSAEPGPAVPRVDDSSVDAGRPARAGVRPAAARRAARSSTPSAGPRGSTASSGTTRVAAASAAVDAQLDPPRSEAAEAIEPAPERLASPVVTRDELDAEIRLLRAARAALESGAAERALAILDQHAEGYPRGTLAQERLATRALALCALGRVQAARTAVRELSRLSPSSPHLARLRASCAAPVAQ